MMTHPTDALVQAEWERQSELAKVMESRFAEGVAIYGAGSTGMWGSSYLLSLGAKVTKFIDRDSRKIGSSFNGIPVVACTDEILDASPTIFTAVRSTSISDLAQAMARRGAAVMSFDGYFVLRNFQRYQALKQSFFCDERSVAVLNGIMMAMLTNDIRHCRDVAEKDIYFSLPEFMCNFHEVFVDAGAYVGDTVERFIWGNMGEFAHIHAFEPGPRQFKALERRTARLIEEWALDPASISLIQAGLSDVDGGGDIRDTGMASKIEPTQEEGSESVKVMTLDRYLAGRSVDFIKTDVEGMDMELLRGAQRTIRTCKPKLALAAYHCPDHLFRIAEYVRELVPEYKFYLRLHAYLLGEFVLYCTV